MVLGLKKVTFRGQWMSHGVMAISTSFVVLSYFYPLLASQLAFLFKCQSVELPLSSSEGSSALQWESSLHWLVDPEVKCYQGVHLILVLSVGVILFLLTAGYPLAQLYLTISRRTPAGHLQTRHKYLPQLYEAYLPRTSFWTIIINLRMLICTVVAVALIHVGSPDLQPSVLLVVLGCCFLLHCVVQPYRELALNQLAAAQLICLQAVVFLSLLMMQQTGSQKVLEVLAVVIVSLPIWFLLVVVCAKAPGVHKRVSRSPWFCSKTRGMRQQRPPGAQNLPVHT